MSWFDLLGAIPDFHSDPRESQWVPMAEARARRCAGQEPTPMICPTCKTAWYPHEGTETHPVDRACTCNEPHCDRRLAVCCFEMTKAAPCSFCGKAFCLAHLRDLFGEFSCRSCIEDIFSRVNESSPTKSGGVA